MTRVETLSEDELEAWGRRIGAEVAPPFFLALEGPVGAGKSVLARSIARGAGVEGPVPSPTYTLVRTHARAGGGTLVHLDLYRLSGPDEVIELGWDDLLGRGDAFVVVEWAGRAGAHLPPDRWAVHLSPVAGAPDRRAVERRRFGAPPPLPAPRPEGAP